MTEQPAGRVQLAPPFDFKGTQVSRSAVNRRTPRPQHLGKKVDSYAVLWYNVLVIRKE